MRELSIDFSSFFEKSGLKMEKCSASESDYLTHNEHFSYFVFTQQIFVENLYTTGSMLGNRGFKIRPTLKKLPSNQELVFKKITIASSSKTIFNDTK